jgi:lathosterol oxidase
LLVAGFAWWLFGARWSGLDSEFKHDFGLSVVSAGIFAIAMGAAVELYSHGYGRIYWGFHYGDLLYMLWSYLFVLILQDGYFYITHRMLHHPRLYRWAHRGHHRSRHPSPWTSFAFDPFEAFVHALFLLLVMFLIPLHLVTVLAVLVTMTIWAVVNHLGLEKLPVCFAPEWLGHWFVGPQHHSVHHDRQNLHFGLYFTFWDRLLGTQDRKFASS